MYIFFKPILVMVNGPSIIKLYVCGMSYQQNLNVSQEIISSSEQYDCLLNYFIVATTQQQQQPFYGPLSGTTWVSRHQKKHSPTHHPDHHSLFISFFHLPRSIASSLFKLRAWQSFCTTSFDVVFGLPLVTVATNMRLFWLCARAPYSYM